MAQVTSILSYKEMEETLGERQRVVYFVLSELKEATDKEISVYLDLPINTITPRRFELVEMGLVREKEKRICKITGKLAISWCLGGKKETPKNQDCLSSVSFGRLVRDLRKCNDYQRQKISEVLDGLNRS